MTGDERSHDESPRGPRVAIIAGAGPAGLTAAKELLDRTDVVPLVLEPTNTIGGIAQTFAYKGNRLDIGGHRFYSRSRRVTDWWFRILPPEDSVEAQTAGDDVMLVRTRLSRILYHGRFFPYPIGITLRVAWRLGLWNTARIALSYLRASLFPLADERYLDAFFINRFGRRLYETFFRAYTEKVWGVPCSSIRSDWGAQRVKGLSLTRALVHAVRDLLSHDFRQRQEARETSLLTRFHYPPHGPGQLWEKVAEDVAARGGAIGFGKRAIGTCLVGGRVSHVRVRDDESGTIEEIPCDYFISSMPLGELIDGMIPAAPAGVLEVAKGLRYRAFLTVGVLLTKLHVIEAGRRVPRTSVDDNWIYVQDGGVQVGRIQIFNNWSPAMVADPEHTTWIGLEYFVDDGDALWSSSNEALRELAIQELERIHFARREDVLDACVVRMPKAYPAYYGTYDRVGEVERYVGTIPNLFCVGRNGMHRYNNQDHSMLTAMMAVDNIVSGEVDKTAIWRVNAEEIYGEGSE
jgi:protoporphyrinogen oxidase